MRRIFLLLPVLLVVVSSCPDGGFNCTSGECLPAGLVCDYKKDCEDGSDEEYCGSCDFEHHSCSWKDTSGDKRYRWRRQMANVTSMPGRDHTTGSPFGHVMHIDGRQEGGFLPKANLEYSVANLTALGCQISFWYYIHDNQSLSSSSSALTLTMVRGGSPKQLKVSKSKTDIWENATALIGNQPGGYKLLFSFQSNFFEKKDVMLDDIRFEYCAEGDVPAGSDQLTCDFEKDTCSWYHDYTASLLWETSDGRYDDGPSGNGYYMVITAKSNLDISSRARLVSFPLPAGQVICVSFMYHIFGNSIGSLKFIAKHPGEEETVVWLRSGTQGNKWRFADLTFKSDKPIQFILEATVGGTQGSIAIDDVTVSSGEEGSCPAERECTFQGSLCGLLPRASADFSWVRINGTSRPSNSSGPATDHTLGTEEGYYLSAQLWRHPVGSRGAVMTAVLEPTPSDGECLMFWYYMEGRDVGELSVHLQTPGNNTQPARLWSREGDQGKHWRHARVTLLSVDSPYQVIFEAEVGDGPRRDVAIDDLTVMNGACPPPGFCDFELDMCGWVNSHTPAGTGLDWDWLSANSHGKFIPSRDHTTNSVLGHFVFFIASQSDGNETARLESETMQATERACLEIWHFASAWLQGPSKVTLTVLVNETAGLRPVWNTSGYANSKWIRDRVDYSASGPHQIILQASTNTKEANFALDDLHIIRDKSCEELIPTTTPVPPTTTTPAPPSAMDCTFENGLCSWVQEDDDDSSWTLSRGREVDQRWDGPQYDHTVENDQGFFLLLSGSGSKDGEHASVSAPVSGVTSGFCVGFWFYMLGPSVPGLDLLVETKSSRELVWTRRGTQSPEWVHAQVTISMTGPTKLIFTGHRNINSRGFVALDDITVRSGACSEQKVCGFDSSWCDFENDVQHKGRWGRERGTEHEADHTYGTQNGFYMTVTSNSAKTEVAQLLTPEFTSAPETCVRFWYWLGVGSTSSLSVHVLRSGETGDALWERSVAPSTGWEVAQVTVSSPVKFHVVFKAFHVPGSNSTVRLDDVSVSIGACSPPASCDFESGQCTWVGVPKEDGHESHDWVLAHGGFRGPPTDQTTQTPEGQFLLSSALHQSHSSLARVLSEWIHFTDDISCLTLWYQINSSDSGTLKVSMRSGPEDTPVFSSSSGPSWTRFSQSVDTSTPFQLLIEAESNNRGYIAIDDITVTPGLCQVNETNLGFVGCSFENGACGWEDVSIGQLQWIRGKNASEDIGPSVDHTVGSELGWYMAVGSDRGGHMTPAALHSPTMTQASATCTLHFFYNMCGDDIEELTVRLKDGPRTTTLWRLAGNHGDEWHHGEVVIGRVTQDFSILFEASRSFTQPGHIAIDDVEFTNCTLPEPQDQCPQNMFTCDNKVCVERNQVCDFSDDCGDRSDEDSCEEHGVVERCSFEQGLCSWAGSEVDTAGDEWRLHRGEEAGPPRGPPRDHTQNSAAGFYVTPHLVEKSQTAEIVSKTLLPSSNCIVKFFFFSLDDAVGGLTAQSRTARSGSGDSVLWLRGQTQSQSWRRAVVSFSTTSNSKIVFRYERGEAPIGLVALDDISFSRECVFDPDNSKLPETPPTTAAPPPTTTAPPSPCQGDEFFCWRSEGEVCVASTGRCDYRPDCPQGEDEDGCGSCTFERDLCQWTDRSDGQSKWTRQKANNDTEPPTDHTTHTGHFMTVNFIRDSAQTEARLQSPPLSPSSPYCQILFHFHMGPQSAGSLRVLMQQAGGSEAILWSRRHNTGSHWTAERLPLGPHTEPYEVRFSGTNAVSQAAGNQILSLDDISFVNCEKSYKPPALSACGCSFEDGLCDWLQGAEDESDWLSWSGPTETPNTGPAGDHTTGKGKYLYIKSSPPSVKGNMAQLKSPLLPPAGDKGYCLTFWQHMFGPTVGSLKIILLTAGPLKKTLVWQRSGNQGDEWRPVQIHVTLQEVHQLLVEGTVGGQTGDIAIDDFSLVGGPCPASDVCDFEEGSCNWQQQAGDDFDWVRQSGPALKPNTGPDSDHTTGSATGHYYLLSSSAADRAGQSARMFSPLYPADKAACVQLWYHMYGRGTGTLNVYQQSAGGEPVLIFSQTGDQGRLWRLAQASLLPRVQPYRIVVEGVKAGPTQEGDLALDDVGLTDAQCPRHGHCDFETNMCSWSNLRAGGGVGRQDWLRGRGASPNPNTGPTVDHTTNSTHGFYVYVDSSMGEWGDMSYLISEVFQPSTRGHCLTFWYHMYGDHVGTLRVYVNDRQMHDGGDEEGTLRWIETGNKGDKWQEARVPIKHEEAFWFVFVYQRGMNTGGDTALDDITILPGGCYPDPPVNPPDTYNEALTIGLAVGLTLLAGVIVCITFFMWNRMRGTMNQPTLIENEVTDQTSAIDLFDRKEDDTQRGTQPELSFFNKLFAPTTDPTMDASNA